MSEIEEWLAVGGVLIAVVVAAVLYDRILHYIWDE
jgi:hypothetical protein